MNGSRRGSADGYVYGGQPSIVFSEGDGAEVTRQRCVAGLEGCEEGVEDWTHWAAWRMTAVQQLLSRRNRATAGEVEAKWTKLADFEAGFCVFSDAPFGGRAGAP